MTSGGTHTSGPDSGAKPEPNRRPSVGGDRHEKVVAAPYVSVQTWGRRLALQWRDRCEAGGVAPGVAVSSHAAALCEAVVRTLEQPSQAPNLAQAARAWAAGLSSPSEAGSALVSLREVAAQ